MFLIDTFDILMHLPTSSNTSAILISVSSGKLTNVGTLKKIRQNDIIIINHFNISLIRRLKFIAKR